MSRHTARIHAFNLVFQFPFHPEWDVDALNQTITAYLTNMTDLQEFLDGTKASKKENSFIEKEVSGTFAGLSQIDNMIDDRLKNWELNRIPTADLALLRLAVYELLFSTGITTATVINEAVELAKLYGTENSSSFINGVLGKIAQNKEDTKNE